MPPSTVKVFGYRQRIVVPYLRRNQKDANSLTKALAIVGNLQHFTKYLDTARTPFAKRLNFRLDAIDVPILRTDEVGEAGYLLISIECAGEVSDNELFALMSSTNEWVRLALGKNDLMISVGYIYTILIVDRTSPPISKELLDRDVDLLTKLVPGLHRPDTTATPDADFVRKMVGPDLGTAKTQCYRLSLHGALIYDRNYAISRKYVADFVIPTIAELRAAQALFEAVNAWLDGQLKQNPQQINDQTSEQLGRSKQTALRALAVAERSQSFGQLTEISVELKQKFGVNSLQSSLNAKVDVLNSMLQQLSDEREKRFNKRLTLANILLAIIGVLLALLALPAFANWLSKVPPGKSC